MAIHTPLFPRPLDDECGMVQDKLFSGLVPFFEQVQF
jgi:hypothetical protein